VSCRQSTAPISLNCSAALARGAFAAAKKAYPNRRMRLKWGAYIIERYEPKKASDESVS
jgi:hypothetical protein